MVLFVLAVVTTPAGRFRLFGLFAITIATVIVLSGVPVLYVLRRSCLVLPFVLLTAAFLPLWKATADGQASLNLLGVQIDRQGLVLAGTMAVKGLLAATAMIVLSATTRFGALLKGLEAMRLPKVMLMILSFMYRYLFIAIDQSMRMDRARRSRDCGSGYLRRMRTLGNMIGMLFVRSYERSERVYQSMVSRGFDGEIRNISRLHIESPDYIFSAIFITCLAAIRVAGQL
jgi:cobalt/nickel transport system permease protein